MVTEPAASTPGERLERRARDRLRHVAGLLDAGHPDAARQARQITCARQPDRYPECGPVDVTAAKLLGERPPTPQHLRDAATEAATP